MNVEEEIYLICERITGIEGEGEGEFFGADALLGGHGYFTDRQSADREAKRMNVESAEAAEGTDGKGLYYLVVPVEAHVQ